jgi:hypothetical protein
LMARNLLRVGRSAARCEPQELLISGGPPFDATHQESTKCRGSYRQTTRPHTVARGCNTFPLAAHVRRNHAHPERRCRTPVPHQRNETATDPTDRARAPQITAAKPLLCVIPAEKNPAHGGP